MTSPITDIRDIVAEHERDHIGDSLPDILAAGGCRCMERIGYIMQVFYPVGAEYQFANDEDFNEGFDGLGLEVDE